MHSSKPIVRNVRVLRRVLIKGGKGDDAVLCTSSKTYALKLVETTNSLLLLPPQEVRWFSLAISHACTWQTSLPPTKHLTMWWKLQQGS